MLWLAGEAAGVLGLGGRKGYHLEGGLLFGLGQLEVLDF